MTDRNLKTQRDPLKESMQTAKGATLLTSMRLSDLMGRQDQPVFSPDKQAAKCKLCQEFNVVVIRFPSGKIGANQICDDCHTALKAEEEKRKVAHRHANVGDLLARSGVPKRFLSCTLDNFNGYDRLELKERPTFISGPVGTGKTHLSVAYLGQDLVQHGDNHGRFLEAVELFMRLRGTFSKDSPLDESGILYRYIKTPLLVLDDLGAEKVSDYVVQSLYFLINKRYGDCMDTIITSNLSLGEIGQIYGDRLASRIAGMGKELVLQGKDRRLG